MPIVKYIERESNLPEAVACEMDRFTSGYVSLEDYEAYRNAAVALHKRRKVKLSRDKLYKLAESVREQGVFGEFNWAISNTSSVYWMNKYKEDKERAGQNFDEKQWETDYDRNSDVFEASLFDWQQIDSQNEHPAIKLLMLISQYDPRSSKESK